MTFRLSPELRARLIAAAGERPIGEEIRRRLERSFQGSYEPRLEGQTLALFDGIAAAIELLGSRRMRHLVATQGLSELGPWHADPNSFAGLQTTIHSLLEIFRPEGEPGEIASEWIAPTTLGTVLRAIHERDPKLVEHVLGAGQEDDDDKART
jgi:hypothetical protein